MKACRRSKGRLIPARAGNIGTGQSGFPRAAAHPRSRGEHSSYRYPSSASDGSSPLARGTSTRAENVRRVTRLIPARAGNMASRVIFDNAAAAHPRSRGEHVPVTFAPERAFGSSPLARGTSYAAALRSIVARLIPARAGNISRHGPRFCARAAHPRSRGEHPNPSLILPGMDGSSPLARGTSNEETHECYPSRLIPARAGNILLYTRLHRVTTAHPRSRGEHR